MNNAADTKTGFNIGFDYAFYRLALPEYASKEIVDGYEHKKHRGSTKKSSVFIRKWLTARLHAYERGIHFSSDVTPRYLEYLFANSKGVCPITNDSMTMGTLTGTDWSIDRIINTYGYSTDNIVIMSTRANKAKGTLSLDEVKNIRDSGKEYEGLTSMCWGVLYQLMWKAQSFLDTAVCDDTEELLSSSEYEEVLVLWTIDKFTEPCVENREDIASHLLKTALDSMPKHKEKEFMKTMKRIIVKRASIDVDTGLCELLMSHASIKKMVATAFELLDKDMLVSTYSELISKWQGSANECLQAERFRRHSA